MNLNAVAGGIVSVINPYEAVTLRSSTGYTQDSAFRQVPTYAVTQISAQFQPLSDDDLKQLDGVNLEGLHRAVYANSQLHGLDRDSGYGGDLITRHDGTVWLVVQVLEEWSPSGWCKAAATKQLRSN